MDDFPWFKFYEEKLPRTLEPYPEITLLDVVSETVRLRPNHTALIFKGARISYAELERLSDNLAAALVELGVQKGERVAFLLPNSPQAAIAQIGAWKAGAIVAPMNSLYTERELEQMLNEIEAETVIVLTPFYAKLKSVQPKTSVKRVIATNIKEYLPPVLRFLFTIAPAIAAFLLAEWLALTGTGTFAGLLGTISALSLPLLGGIFPALLLAATRRKGDFVPGIAFRLLGHPWTLAAIFLFYWATILMHGLVIWRDPLLRVLALSTSLVVLGVTIIMLRRGALDPRVVIELRQDRRLGMRDEFNVTANGEPLSVNVCLEYAEGEQRSIAFTGPVPVFGTLRAASFELPASRVRQLKVWAHQMTPDSKSLGLPMRLQIGQKNGVSSDHKLSNGLVVVALSGEACSVRLSFATPLANAR